MNRFQIENLYLAKGINDFILRTPEDLLKIHDIDIKSLKGFNTLTDDNIILFKKFIINLLNCWGLESRLTLIPIAINFVEDIEYLVKENLNDDAYTVAGGIIKAILSNGKKVVLHKWIYEDYVNLEKIQGKSKHYLRFEYKHGSRKEWLHVIGERTWY